MASRMAPPKKVYGETLQEIQKLSRKSECSDSLLKDLLQSIPTMNIIHYGHLSSIRFFK